MFSVCDHRDGPLIEAFKKPFCEFHFSIAEAEIPAGGLNIWVFILHLK